MLVFIAPASGGACAREALRLGYESRPGVVVVVVVVVVAVVVAAVLRRTLLLVVVLDVVVAVVGKDGFMG